MAHGQGFVIVFIVVLVGGGILGLLLGRLIRAAGLGAGDRFLGGVFGIVRGILILMVAVLLASLTPVTNEAFWRTSMVVGPIEDLLGLARPYLPEVISERLRLIQRSSK
jgi:membrane protein required for colicin V production